MADLGRENCGNRIRVAFLTRLKTDNDSVVKLAAEHRHKASRPHGTENP